MRLQQYLTEAVIKVDTTKFRKTVEGLKDLLIGKQPSTMLKILNNTFRGNGNVVFTEREAGGTTFSGQFVGDNEKRSNPAIEIEVPFSYLKNLNDHNFKQFVDGMVSVYAHEMVHREQYNRAFPNFHSTNSDDYEEYLSNPSELMAFASHIYQDFINKGLDRGEMITILKRLKIGHSDMLDKYIRNLKGKNDKALHRLITYLIGYIGEK